MPSCAPHRKTGSGNLLPIRSMKPNIPEPDDLFTSDGPAMSEFSVLCRRKCNAAATRWHTPPLLVHSTVIELGEHP